MQLCISIMPAWLLIGTVTTVFMWHSFVMVPGGEIIQRIFIVVGSLFFWPLIWMWWLAAGKISY